MRNHGPYCTPPDEVGDPGMCCCDGTEETVAAMHAEYEAEKQQPNEPREDGGNANV